MKKEIKIFCSESNDTKIKDVENSYELLDTGEGEKLERFGKYTFVRPYENAVWKKTLSKKEWGNADGRFVTSKEKEKSGWQLSKKILGVKRWEMEYKGIKFFASPTPFRHLSFFPEQISHWDFIEKNIKTSFDTFVQVLGSPVQNFKKEQAQSDRSQKHANSVPEHSIKFLNLFGYTGVASLFALRAGAEVTHVDASKLSVTQAKENQNLNPDLIDAPMRLIVDDVIKFLDKEIKRGNKYDAVIMDPPKFGRGPKGEIWKIEKDLPILLEKVQKVLSKKPIFVILTSYATQSSPLNLKYSLEDKMKVLGGKVEAGEMCVFEKSNSRFISLANTAIWFPL